ncbi:MAG: ABC transporter substrate-binding protein [Anaerolineae bacterium]|nr:ABC transporter substrate-binding protein [Anaerolineae bacterium]
MSSAARRFVLLAVCAVLALSGFSTLAQDGVTVNFYYPTAVDAPINEIIQGYADQFMAANPGITINPVYTGTYTQTRDTINTELQGGGAGPTVAVMLTTDLYSFIEEGSIVPAQQFIDQMEDADAFMADFFPALLLNSVDEEGTIWSVPFQRSTPILFYNKDLFREAGLDPETAPKNLDELIAAAQALTLPNGERWGLMVPVQGGFPIWLFQSFAIAAGRNLSDADPTNVYLNEPESLAALTDLIELGTVDGVMPAGGSVWGDTPTAFLAGQAGMIYHTTGSLTNILNNATFEVGVGFLPSGPAGEDGTGYGSPTGGGNLYVFANATPEEQAAAWQWIEFLASPEIQSDWGMKTGYIASRVSAWELDPLAARVAEFPQYGVARDQLAIAEREFTSYRAIDIQNIINSTLSSLISGSVPLADAQATLDAAQAQIDALLAEYK